VTKLGFTTYPSFPYSEAAVSPTSAAFPTETDAPETSALRQHSFSARAQGKNLEEHARRENSFKAIELMQSLLGQDPSEKTQEILKSLVTQVQNGEKLKVALDHSPARDRAVLQEKIGEESLRKILSLSENADSRQFWKEALHLGVALKLDREFERSGALFSWIAEKA